MSRTLWIDRPQQLREFCASIEGDVIAVDTESDHFHSYNAQVCLIQVGTPERSALIDPFEIDGDELQPLFALLRDPRMTTLLHSARNDIMELDRDYGVGIANLFDTQIATKFLGYERTALSWLQEELVGSKPSGKYQRFDWTTRPIPEKARAYAVADVADLFPLHERFVPELRDSGWLEPFRQHCAYVATVSEFEPTPFDPEGWRKVGSKWKLDGPGRAALRELFVARHEICTEENRAGLFIFPKKALLQLAEARPTSIDELYDIRKLPEETVARHGDKILEAVERAKHAEIPPEKPPRQERRRPSRDESARFDALRNWRNRTAKKLDLPGQLIAVNATLSEIAADPPETVEGLDAFIAILPWHREMFGEEIIGVLEGV